MKNLELGKSRLEGSVIIPPSKSVAHRAIICASLGKGSSKISNVDYSDDIIATIKAMEALGANISKEDNTLLIKGIFSEDNKINLHREIDCNESGSTLRFLVPISLLFDGESRFIGRGNLGKRPLDTYYNIFKEQDIEFTYKEDVLDLNIKGKLKPSEFNIPGNISSQFITGLLFTLPLLKEDSKIIITTKLESKGYIDLTLDTMKDFGINIINNDYKEFIIKGNQSYESKDYTIEGDYSQAAFYIVANMLGSDIELLGLKKNSKQGDKEILDIVKRMGGIIEEKDNSLKVKSTDSIKGIVIDATNCPDIIPVVTLLAALAEGETKIINAKRLRIKECDRLKAITEELTKVGAKITEYEDSLVIEGVKNLYESNDLWSWKDHRIAMTLAVAATVIEGKVTMKDYDCVSKSYPNFYKDYKNLGGKLWEQHGEIK